MTTYRKAPKGFTLVEILIVVIILGILAAVVIPQFTNASEDARTSSAASQLQTIRSAVELYKLQHRDMFPTTDGTADATKWSWTLLTSKTNEDGTSTGTPKFGPYLQATPVNPLTGKSDVAAAAAADKGWVFQTDGRVMGITKAGGLMSN
jgi:general secretion pathway protein G